MRRASFAALGIAAFLASSSAIADKPAETLVQVAQGQAAILNGDKPAAREKAIQDALRQAVQMAVGTQVTATTQIENFQTKLDQVLTRSSGYVRKYSIVKEGQDGDVVQVTVSAEVAMGALNSDLEAMGLLLQRKGLPRTMVLIAEQNIGMAAPQAAWIHGDGAVASADLRIAENVVLDELRKGGFRQLVEPDIAESQTASVGGITTSITASQARKLGSLTQAEVIVIGQVVATGRGDVGEDAPGWRTCVANFSARAVNTDNGDILATSETTQSSAALDDLSCGKEAIKKASKVFTADITRKIAERWSSDLSAGNEVRLSVKGVDSLRTANELKSSLLNFVRGVKGVTQRSYADGAAEYDVQLVGSTDDFATALETKKIGTRSVKVKGLTANTVSIELKK